MEGEIDENIDDEEDTVIRVDEGNEAEGKDFDDEEVAEAEEAEGNDEEVGGDLEKRGEAIMFFRSSPFSIFSTLSVGASSLFSSLLSSSSSMHSRSNKADNVAPKGK